MQFERLKQHICDMILEEQLKLGYREETVRLYYLLPSLNRLLGTEADMPQMHFLLQEFAGYAAPDLGMIGIRSLADGRIGFVLPPEAGRYVKDKEKSPQAQFLREFLDVISRHGAGIDDITAVFEKWSDRVHVEHTPQGDFDYLVYFEDGDPDAYRYCITQEGPHLSYHRFTTEDYAAEFMS